MRTTEEIVKAAENDLLKLKHTGNGWTADGTRTIALFALMEVLADIRDLLQDKLKDNE